MLPLKPAALAVLVAIVSATLASAQIIYVDQSAPPGGDGNSWARAYTDLQEGIAWAGAHPEIKEIWVAEGTYLPTTTGDRAVSFVLLNGVGIYGGFVGTEANRDDRDPVAHPTVLSGDIGTVGYSGDNSSYVVAGNGNDASAVLDGFTVTQAGSRGLSLWSSSPTITGCTFTTNPVGVACTQSSPTVANCSFSFNSSSAMESYTSSLSVVQCTFSDNAGQAIASTDGILSIIGCTFSSNGRGAIGNGGGTLTVLGSVFRDNTAATGGAVFISGTSSAEFSDCAFRDNEATSPDYPNSGGGAIGAGNPVTASLTLTRCTFSNNRAPFWVGGAVSWAFWIGSVCPISATDCIFEGNSASGGGGIAAGDGGASFTRCVFTNNLATGTPANGRGGAIESSSLTVDECMFSGNQAKYEGGAVDCGGDHSLVATNCWFSDNNVFGTNSVSGGGAVALKDGVLENCVFSGNSVPAPLNGGGGAVRSVGRSKWLNCEFSDNFVGDNPGGGAMQGGPETTLISCAFARNAVHGVSYARGGGAVYADGPLSAINCRFDGNYIDGVDPGYLQYRGGGAIYQVGGPSLVVNCVFMSNWTNASGGGVMTTNSKCILTSSTFNANSAGTSGGAIYGVNVGDTPTVSNSILWGNDAPSGAQLGGSVTVKYSCVEGGYSGTGNIKQNPRYVNPSGGDFHLLTGSPCVNAGSNALLPADSADLDGDGDTTEPMPVDLDWGPRVLFRLLDMGAYEAGESAAGTLHVAPR